MSLVIFVLATINWLSPKHLITSSVVNTSGRRLKPSMVFCWRCTLGGVDDSLQQGEGHLSEAKTLVAPTSFCLRALRKWGGVFLLLPATGRCNRFASCYLFLAYCMQRYKIIIQKKYFYVFLHII